MSHITQLFALADSHIMKTPGSRCTRFAAILSLGAVSAAWSAAPVDLVIGPRPQSYTDSCQSYGIALAIASLPKSPFPSTTAQELVTAEKEFRKWRDSVAAEKKLDPTSHEVWRLAVERMSSNGLTLVREKVASGDALFARVAELTGIKKADTLGPIFSAALAKTPVMTSVTQIGNDKYPGGHIVTVFGIAERNVSPPRLLVLNPAVKIGALERKTCNIEPKDATGKYLGQLAIEDAFSLKSFPGEGYVLLYVSKK